MKRTGAKSCKRRDCSGYVELWMGDQGMRLQYGLREYGGLTAMLTLTAPGVESLPWDKSSCTHPADVRCSGTRGCRTDPEALRRFNEGSMRAWSALWDAVQSRVYRAFGAGSVRLLGYAPEPQKRGAIHFHLIFGAGTPRERQALDLVVELLPLMAAGYGWGRVHHRRADSGRPDARTVAGVALYEAGRAASYVAKYLTAPDKSSSVRELVIRGEAPRRAVYVAPSLTSRSGVTMRSLRAKRHVYARARVRLHAPVAAAVIACWRMEESAWISAGRRPACAPRALSGL